MRFLSCRRAIAVGLGATMALSGLVTDSAGAAPSEAAPQITSYSGKSLRQATKPERDVTGKSRDRARRYTDDSARNGRLVDAKRVQVATLQNVKGAGQVDLVWDDQSIPDYVGVVTQGSGDQAQTGVGVVFTEPTTAAAPAANAGGFGYESGYSLRGMYQYGNTGCRTVYFNPEYAHSSDHWTTTCYQKFAQSGTNRWIYNRWALFTRGTPASGIRAEIVDYTTRSRPAKGHESKVIALDGWTTAQGNNSCSTVANVNLNVTSNVGISIPIHRCSTTKELPEANLKSMGMDWSGNTQNQLYEDYGMAIRASSTSAVPVMADYLWAEVRNCGQLGIPCVNGTNSQYLALKDAGW